MKDLDEDGYGFADLLLTPAQCEHVIASLPAVTGSARGGVRNLINHPIIVSLLHHERLGKLLWSVAGRQLVAVKATLFDKTLDANWRVQWHQDRSIAVKDRLHISGYGPWSTKAGTLHVEPPAEVLAQMIALRIHLDPCGPENGPMRVIPGTHREGKLKDDDLATLGSNERSVELHAPQGSFLIFRPLLVHSSSSALAPAHRRVLHIEFAPPEAISPLQWHSTVQLRVA